MRWPVATAAAAALLGVWQVAAMSGRLPGSVPGPRQVAAGVVDLVVAGELGPLIGASLGRAAAGFTLGVAAGAILGLLAGVSRVVEDLVGPPIAITSAIPKVAVFPSLAVWLGVTDATRIVVIVLVCAYPVYFAALHGTRGIDSPLLWVARSCGASRRRIIAQVVVPAALPRVLVGVRVALALAFVMVFATEIIGFPPGLGSLIYRAYLTGRVERMYGGIVVLGVLGAGADAALRLLTRRLTRGQSLGTVSGG